ncbi:hypothetical protein AGMMS49992_32750 [Clostridia bacterium]|nr:hypothetical protein AGMMS49992_32750 [Clostridia bacterium]
MAGDKGRCRGKQLDVVAVACEWTEYDAEELADEYSHLLDEDEEYESQEDRMEAIVEALEDETTVIKVDIDSYLASSDSSNRSDKSMFTTNGLSVMAVCSRSTAASIAASVIPIETAAQNV